MRRTQVTPFAGVWIEIWILRVTLSATQVTPFAGVWIEMKKSLPIPPAISVTPFAGVWIEIAMAICLLCLSWSLPLRECGLKSKRKGNDGKWYSSLPLRECGLKFFLLEP